MARDKEGTAIGRVRHIAGSLITVELSPSLAGFNPIWHGLVHGVGQIGSLIAIPQGASVLLASVSLVGVAELTTPLQPSVVPSLGDRWIQASLIGEIDARGIFARGVSRYPALDDAVHFAVEPQLRALYPLDALTRIVIGHLSASNTVAISLDVGKLVSRHSAVVGSTGSGKTSTVAALVQSFVSQGWAGANVVIVDPHGEYGSAFPTNAQIRSVLGTGPGQLRVPFWGLPAADLLRALTGGGDSATVLNRFSDLVMSEKRRFANAHPWVTVPGPLITPDSPIPFDLRDVWYRMAYDNSATYEKQGGGGAAKETSKGDSATLAPPAFEPYSLGSSAPFKGPQYGVYGQSPDRMLQRLRDHRFDFIFSPQLDTSSDPLPALISEWLGGPHPVSVLDFSGVPTEVADVAIGFVLQILFEIALRSGAGDVGRGAPVLVVIEEAHRFLSEGSSNRIAREVSNRIAREGRKYGVGLMLVTQRPAELPATALAQVGTVVALRLTNPADQGTIKAALPDITIGLADTLPALRTGEAVVSGEAIGMPSRVIINAPHPWPRAADPSVESWRKAEKPRAVEAQVAKWRGA